MFCLTWEYISNGIGTLISSEICGWQFSLEILVDDVTYKWRPLNSSIPCKFTKWLMSLGYFPDLAQDCQHDPLCVLSSWSAAPWTPDNCTDVSFSSLQRFHAFQLLLGNFFSNFCAVYSLRGYKLSIKIIVLYWTACLQTYQWCLTMYHFR